MTHTDERTETVMSPASGHTAWGGGIIKKDCIKISRTFPLKAERLVVESEALSSFPA